MPSPPWTQKVMGRVKCDGTRKLLLGRVKCDGTRKLLLGRVKCDGTRKLLLGRVKCDGTRKIVVLFVVHEWCELAPNIEPFKAAFINASSSANFILFLRPFVDFVVPFDMNNELTREQLELKSINNSSQRFLLIRCPIV
ncbi:hypothetical protein niasHT_027915 [Heterodera trifolii]|uniref:Uncharacterized protein n=1 Tax=Heterodera trifolii TaxID=157864 RepID=A0ABD2JDW3_9BILA